MSKLYIRWVIGQSIWSAGSGVWSGIYLLSLMEPDLLLPKWAEYLIVVSVFLLGMEVIAYYRQIMIRKSVNIKQMLGNLGVMAVSGMISGWLFEAFWSRTPHMSAWVLLALGAVACLAIFCFLLPDKDSVPRTVFRPEK